MRHRQFAITSDQRICWIQQGKRSNFCAARISVHKVWRRMSIYGTRNRPRTIMNTDRSSGQGYGETLSRIDDFFPYALIVLVLYSQTRFPYTHTPRTNPSSAHKKSSLIDLVLQVYTSSSTLSLDTHSLDPSSYHWRAFQSKQLECSTGISQPCLVFCWSYTSTQRETLNSIPVTTVSCQSVVAALLWLSV